MSQLTRCLVRQWIGATRAPAAFAAALTLVSIDADAQVLSSKRGFADTGASYPYLQATNAGWYYRWGPDKPDVGNFDAKFVQWRQRQRPPFE